MVDALESRAWTVHTFPRLHAGSHRRRRIPDRGLGRQRCLPRAMSGRTAHLQIEIDDVPVVDRLVCDGIIASTALGSTAYHFSASGRLPSRREGDSPAPSAPFSASRPITLPAEAVRSSAWVQTSPVRAVADGVGHPHVSRIEIEQSRRRRPTRLPRRSQLYGDPGREDSPRPSALFFRWPRELVAHAPGRHPPQGTTVKAATVTRLSPSTIIRPQRTDTVVGGCREGREAEDRGGGGERGRAHCRAERTEHLTGPLLAHPVRSESRHRCRCPSGWGCPES